MAALDPDALVIDGNGGARDRSASLSGERLADQGSGAEGPGDAAVGQRHSGDQPRQFLQRDRVRKTGRRQPAVRVLGHRALQEPGLHARDVHALQTVAYEVWQAVQKKQEPPTPSYADAQRTRITVGVTPAAGAKNPIAAVTIARGGRVVKPVTQSLESGGGGKFIFDFAPFAPTEDITIELAGKARTL